jgi:hypothetical protein
MRELGMELELCSLASRPQLVFAVVSRDDVVEVVCRAKRAAPAPLVAILSIGDERLARRAVDAGAQACWSLDTPLELLEFHLLSLLSSGATTVTENRSAPIFVLGTRARAVLVDLRERSRANLYPRQRVPPDAESRLESAIRADAARQRSPFEFGIHARLELTLMRLEPHDIARLAQAIEADVVHTANRVA